jgi:photosystem II stability/assembly factor-like uncharacterized protein
MKTPRLLFFAAGIGLLAVVSVYYFADLNFKNKKREAFEAFLFSELSQLPEPHVNLKEIPKADRPDVAALQNYYQTLDPQLGYVPFKRQREAWLQTKSIEEDLIAARGTSSLSWTGTRADMGGRTRAIMFDPNDEANLKAWAAGVTGGLWYTDDITDLNHDWEAVDDFWPNLAISSLAYDPVETTTFYAGTGEAQTARVIYRESTGLGIGIMKSMDGGQSWELLPSTADFAYITDVKVREEDGVGVVYAAVVSGTYQGEDHISQPSDGLYRSADGGATWEQVLPLIPDGDGAFYAPAQLEISSDNRIFVGTMENLDKNGGATVLWSDEGTPGSWTAYTFYNEMISFESTYNIPARTIVACAPSDPNIVYAQFAAGYVSGFTYYRGRYMAKSTDGGESWSGINIPDPEWSTLAWHAFALEVDPLNPQAVFTGGLDLWKTMNGGQNWTRVSDWAQMYYGGGDDYVHADQHTIAFRPGNPTQAIFATDGGVFYSNSAHLPVPLFQERNQNFNTLQFYSCAINPTAGSTGYLGGLQDNGTLRFTGNSFTIDNMISGGDGAFCFWDQNQANVFITSVYYNSYYAWLNNNNTGGFGGNSGTFISPADYDYKLNILYSNAVRFSGQYPGRLMRAQGIPSQVTDGLINLGTGNNIPFSAVSYSPHSPFGTSTLFVGTQSGRLYKVTDAQAQPQSIEIGSNDFPTANISSIAIGGSEDTLLVTFSNYGVSSVWQSHDGGSNWQQREGNLPDMPIRWGIFHPQNAGQAMLATETGIWVSNTLLTDTDEWVPANEGLAHVRVDMLRLRESDLTVLAATHGRGLFTTHWPLDIYVGLSEKGELANSLKIYPNPASMHVNISLPEQFTAIELRVYDMQGHLVLTQFANKKDRKLRLAIDHLPEGQYTVQLFSDGKQVERGKMLKIN